MSECKHNHGFPITHDKCDACGSELRLRWDCNSGVYACHSCPGSRCEKCCVGDKRLDGEQFHNAYIRKFKPKCHACGGRCYVSEGFVKKVEGRMVAFCSYCCFEEWDGETEDVWDAAFGRHIPSWMIDVVLEEA